jgi:hypothetical protein
MSKILLSVFISLYLQLSAQIKITGKIITNDNHALEFAEITLLNRDSIGVKSELSNEDGTPLLNVPKSVYTLQIRQLSLFFENYRSVGRCKFGESKIL